MLSKLRHADTKLAALPRHDEVLTASLLALFPGDLADLRPLPGGTLSICYECRLEGQSRFFKTHLTPGGKQTLEREAFFLDTVAGSRVDARLAQSSCRNMERTWLSMKLLRKGDGLSPSTVRDMIDEYESALRHISPAAKLPPTTDSIGLLLSEAEAGLDLLVAGSLLSSDVHRQVARCFDLIRRNYDEWPVQLCHGDLGPANIMTDMQGPLAIDWEDAFWGIPGYDYLYWLTFFSNRPWLSPDVLGRTILDKANEVAVMVMILVLKSAITVRNGSHLKNNISFDRRLWEVINLDER